MNKKKKEKGFCERKDIDAVKVRDLTFRNESASSKLKVLYVQKYSYSFQNYVTHGNNVLLVCTNRNTFSSLRKSDK